MGGGVWGSALDSICLPVFIVCFPFNFKNGLAEELPTSKKLEKQDIIIQEIKRKLQITDLDNLASLR